VTAAPGPQAHWHCHWQWHRDWQPEAGRGGGRRCRPGGPSKREQFPEFNLPVK